MRAVVFWSAKDTCDAEPAERDAASMARKRACVLFAKLSTAVSNAAEQAAYVLHAIRRKSYAKYAICIAGRYQKKFCVNGV